MKKMNKKALAAAIALTVTAGIQVSANDSFSINDLNQNSLLIAHEGEANCGEGKCGADKKEATCGADKKEAKCGADKKVTTKKKVVKEAKCGADKAKEAAPAEKKDAEGKCGEGTCGSEKPKE